MLPKNFLDTSNTKFRQNVFVTFRGETYKRGTEREREREITISLYVHFTRLLKIAR